MSKTRNLKNRIKEILNDNRIETVDSECMGWIPIENKEEALVVISGKNLFLMVINPYCDDGEDEDEEDVNE